MNDAIELLRPYREAGVFSASDVHTSATLARLAEVDDSDVVLAVAIAARAPRHGHVAADLRTVAASIAVDTPSDDDASRMADLHWPDPDGWSAKVAASALVTASPAPLVLHDGLLYLERYWSYEQAVAAQLLVRASAVVEPVASAPHITSLLLDGAGSDRQRAAVDSALHSALTVLVGGPGTGKTTTVAALVATLAEASPGLRVALSAPTGKAAARLGEAFAIAAARLPGHLVVPLNEASALTIHRLLGVTGRSNSRFRHDRGNPLPHDVVIIDETSMVSLPLMAKLLDAVRPDARLVLVGDSGQLASIEAGTVLADIAGGGEGGALSPLAGCVTTLTHSRRFPPTSPLDRFANAVRAGDAASALAVLGDPASGEAAAGALSWTPLAGDSAEALAGVRDIAAPAALDAARHAAAGHPAAALGALERVRVLCAHRRFAFGVDRWNQLVEGWLAAGGAPSGGWYPGRPVLITANDYRLGLFNGDLGVVVVDEGRPQVAFADGRRFGPARLDTFETAHAMTIHKSQGSEFDHVVVVLPPADSRLATRELLYTAVTRARQRVTLVGDEAALRAAIGRQVARASGLRRALWPLDG